MFMNTTAYPNDCLPLLFNISSNGLWENLKSPDVIFEYSLPLMELQILLIFISIAMTHMFLRCIGISQTVSYMFAGLILGPQLFDLREISSGKLSLDHALDGNAALNGFSAFGSLLFAFLTSVRISRRVVFNSGPLPVVIGVLLFVGPLSVGMLFRIFLTIDINPHYMPPKRALAERTMITVIQSSIILPTITYILSELKILNTEFGRLALSASIINDVLGVIALLLVGFLGTYKNISQSTAYVDIIAMIIFAFIVFFAVKPAVEWIIKQTPEGKPVSSIYVHTIMLIVLASAAYTTFFDFRYILGPFIIGLVIPEGPPLGSALEAKYEKLTMNVFLPISIAFTMMRCDVMRIIYELDDIKYNIFILAITLVLKLVAAFVPCMYCKLPLKESLAISILLCCKSFTEIVLYEFTLDDANMSQATFSFLTLHALLNSAIVPVALKSLYDPKRKYIGYQKRNIMSLKPNSDLRVLTCVRRPDNISGAIAFIQLLSSPNSNLPIVVTVLHLVKLVGQLVPVLISHAKKSKRFTSNSYINTVLLTFNQFSHEILDSTTVNIFTALSHENLMHDDICTLALDQATSMIVVPSGRTWTIDGAFESDDEAIRRLNVSLLERAPCSIGILVDHGQFFRRREKKYNIDVGVIFIGGKDDREALSLVKRMRHNPKVRITVIRLVLNQETEYTNWEYILDHEVISQLNDSEAPNDFAYIERTATSGPEVVTIIRLLLLEEEYDLMVVGRDHGMASPYFSGLKQWMELPELGVIGDLLAGRDARSRLSVLVVQQQHHG